MGHHINNLHFIKKTFLVDFWTYDCERKLEALVEH